MLQKIEMPPLLSNIVTFTRKEILLRQNMTLSCYSIVKRRSTRTRRPRVPQSLSCLNAVKRRLKNQRPSVAPLYADVSSIGDRSGSNEFYEWRLPGWRGCLYEKTV